MVHQPEAKSVNGEALAVGQAKHGQPTVPNPKRLQFYLNGKHENVRNCDPSMTLLEFLRVKKGLTGTKLGCGEGGCGACTVVLSGKTVNSCLTPLCAVDGGEVTTVEGIGDTKNPHLVQRAIAEGHGSQCGFCTPGFVMSLYNESQCGTADIESCYDGNLCRCTGYRPLIDAAKSVLQYEEETKVESVPASKSVAVSVSVSASASNCNYTPKVSKTIVGCSGKFPDEVVWHKPLSLEELLAIKAAMPSCKVIGGNTEVGIEVRYKHARNAHMVYIGEVQELRKVMVSAATGELKIGGAVTLSSLMTFLDAEIRVESVEFKTRGYRAMVAMMKWFASTQIRNMATLAGNIVTASPISDMNPVLMALDATLCLRSAASRKTRMVKLRDFFLSYRKVDMASDEIVEWILVPPIQNEYEFVSCYKQARRREDDISIVNACFKVSFVPDAAHKSLRIGKINMCYGGVAPTTIAAKETEGVLKDEVWCAETVTKALDSLAKEISLPDGVPGGMARYRSALVMSFFYKSYIQTNVDVRSLLSEALVPQLQDEHVSGAKNFLTTPHPELISSQSFPTHKGGLQKTNVLGSRDHEPSEDGDRGAVGKSVRHRSALAQCTGEAAYVDDIPEVAGTLHAVFLLSTKAHAKILRIDTALAEAAEGFVAFLSAKDLSAEGNLHGPVSMDEELFRRETVTSTGQPLGIVVAETQELAQEAVKLIQVDYEDKEAVITIDDARKAKSFHSVVHQIVDGDVEKALEEADVTVEGEIAMAGQEHFYLETNVSYAVPGEDGELTVHVSTQNLDKTQKFVAKACGLDRNRVNCRMKRMGGGFGGKESRSVFISAAVGLAAYKLNKPVKMNLDRDVDMWITGTRHPFVGVYKAGANKDGKLVALDVDFYSNVGYSLDLSESVMDRALFHVGNSYKIPNVKTRGFLCMTNTTSNTAFRGFGGPQGMLVAETAVNHLSTKLGMRAEEIRYKNLYEAGQLTHYRQLMVECPLKRMWEEVMKSSDFAARSVKVDEFNKNNRWRKRGISILPVKFGISFTAKHLNQAGALVHVYTDGTVLITHGGTEMGQGLHTKVIQVAAKEFGIEVDRIHVSETATDKVPNTSPTAASASSDLYGMAVLNACEKINGRLAPWRKKLPNASFNEIVAKAYFDRLDLSAHGFYATPYVGYDFTGENPEMCEPFNYFTFGVACSEVEIDTLTGDSRVLRADIVMDLGNSLNPAIDIGQIEGAYTQGFGWCMMEEPVWGYKDLPWIKEGHCFTRGPGTYKIPSSDDVPVEFHVRLLDNSPNPKAIHSSRAVGEPPFFLGATAYFAAYNAILSAREDAGVGLEAKDKFFRVDSPLSAERIRLACTDDITNRVCTPDYRPNGFV